MAERRKTIESMSGSCGGYRFFRLTPKGWPDSVATVEVPAR
jgi:hypothetical protein